MAVPWEKQIEREPDWWFSHKLPHLAVRTHSDWYFYIYKTYGSRLYNKTFKNALEIGPGGSGGYLPIMKGISKRIAVEPIADKLREKGFLPYTKHIRYINCFAEEMPFGDKTFDLVVMSNVLDHVKSVDETLKEVDRVLKDGGYIFFFSYLKVSKPHPVTFTSPGEVNHLFGKYQLLEGHFIKPERTLENPRSSYYVAIYRK